MEFIRRLRGRPESYRRKVSVITALVITAIIFAVWFSVIASNFDSNGEENILSVDEVESPVVSFKNTFRGLFDDFRAGLEDLIN